jgi:regulator of nucleoside diphosphate kinase
MVNTERFIIADFDASRIRKLELEAMLADKLNRATVVPLELISSNIVTMHSRVVYLDEKTKTRREVELVYPEEANTAAGKISVLAPIGSALLGLSVGQTVDWEFPSGEVHHLRVEEILFHPPYCRPAKAS